MSTATRPHSGAVARPAHSGRPRAFAGLVTVSFSSSALAVLKDVDRFGQLAGLPGAAAEFTQDAGAGQRAGHLHDLAVRCCNDLQVHAVPVVLAGVERPVGGEAVDED